MSVGTTFYDNAPSCQQCVFYLSDHHKSDSIIACPRCGQEISDLTDALSSDSPPSWLLEFVPESIARENNVLPFDEMSTGLILLSDITRWSSNEPAEKLQFIFNRNVRYLHADAGAIRDAIDGGYSPLP